jgi:hypothetical protein
MSLSTSIFAHDAFLSVTTMRYDSATNHLQVEMKLTGHDMEKAISEAYGKPFTFDKGTNQDNIDILSKYLSTSFRVKMNDSKRKSTILGYEIGTDDELWVYMEIECPKTIISFNLTNKTLTEVFGLQQNLIHFAYSKEDILTLVCTKHEHTHKINWK